MSASMCCPGCSCVHIGVVGWWDDDSVAVLLNVNIVDESIYGCNDIYLTHTHIFLYFSDVLKVKQRGEQIKFIHL